MNNDDGRVKMTAQYVRDRITQLRIQKGVSEYQMSYDLGHSRGYINNISSGKSLPSMMEFFAICEYFEITPVEFFEENKKDPKRLADTVQQLEQLKAEDLVLVGEITARLLAT